jgi:hypothetical protein
MKDPIEILTVTRDACDGIIVGFSDGTTGEYVAEVLLELGRRGNGLNFAPNRLRLNLGDQFFHVPDRIPEASFHRWRTRPRFSGSVRNAVENLEPGTSRSIDERFGDLATPLRIFKGPRKLRIVRPVRPAYGREI